MFDSTSAVHGAAAWPGSDGQRTHCARVRRRRSSDAYHHVENQQHRLPRLVS